ncbi:hypothetical protein TWF506_003747 [Arthrobotrys conoides]|uniref:FAD-binding PCMH-type domain-containing protein n=1 Tax=Arthrobotrys conoides TaxID=74498 RepID=A0AAN8RK40_9PEZI
MHNFEKYSNELKVRLSETARIAGIEGRVIRWDESTAPNPVMNVFPCTESDVVETVKYCRENGLKCFVQNGGHNWRVRNHKTIDVVIHLRAMNKVSINEENQTVVIGGGILVGGLIEAVTAKKLEVVTGGCNTVGVLGNLLHGGLGRYTGKYGLGLDNLLSANLVDATGKLHHLDKTTNPDLWWAIRGAGSSFGIVTEATIKAHPQSNDGLSWSCTLIFTNPDVSKFQAIFKAIEDTEMEDIMSLQCSLVHLPAGPSIIAVPWYYGPEDKAEKVWKQLLDIEPTVKEAKMLPANKLNDVNDASCAMGGRKPSLGMGIERLDSAAFLEIWNLMTEFSKTGAGGPAILIERFPKAKTLSFADDTVFPPSNRGIGYEVVCFPIYQDAALDDKAKDFVQTVRNIWVQQCGDPKKPSCYGACAGFDEPLETMFGDAERVKKLMTIKRKWDPENYWGALFDLP